MLPFWDEKNECRLWRTQPNRAKGRYVNWLFIGILATIFMGFYGLFGKLSTYEQPVISNLVICCTLFGCGIIFALTSSGKMRFSLEAFLSGIFSDIASLIVLFTLISNQVLVVFSFVSSASAVFFVVILV